MVGRPRMSVRQLGSPYVLPHRSGRWRSEDNAMSAEKQVSRRGFLRTTAAAGAALPAAAALWELGGGSARAASALASPKLSGTLNMYGVGKITPGHGTTKL